MSRSTKVTHEFGAVTALRVGVNQVRGSGALGNFTTGTDSVILVQTTGAATATLGAAGSIGTTKTIVLHTDGGDVVLTPSTLVGGTTVTFADAGDSATFVYTSAGWVITSNVGAVVA
jgi:hypothetical protein